ERELLVVLSREDLAGRASDGLRFFPVQQTQLRVDARGGLLDAYQGVDHGKRHALARDAEEAQAALGLRAPQAPGRDLDGAEAVLLDAGAAHRGRYVTSSAGCAASTRSFREPACAASGGRASAGRSPRSPRRPRLAPRARCAPVPPGGR